LKPAISPDREAHLDPTTQVGLGRYAPAVGRPRAGSQNSPTSASTTLRRPAAAESSLLISFGKFRGAYRHRGEVSPIGRPREGPGNARASMFAVNGTARSTRQADHQPLPVRKRTVREHCQPMIPCEQRRGSRGAYRSGRSVEPTSRKEGICQSVQCWNVKSISCVKSSGRMLSPWVRGPRPARIGPGCERR
jgi:hypothetical protein